MVVSDNDGILFYMIRYQTTLEGITTKELHGFFVGWSNRPLAKTHLKLLKNSDHVVLAIDTKSKRVVGFVTAITDGVLASYIPLLEVLPEYRSNDIGGRLMKKMLHLLKDLYMIDLLCDKNLQSYYEKFGLKKAQGMMSRNYKRQSGA